MWLVIKRASLERDYKSQPLADCGINFHTTYEYSGIHLRTPHTYPTAHCTADFFSFEGSVSGRMLACGIAFWVGWLVKCVMSYVDKIHLHQPWKAWLLSSGVVSLRCMFMLCARFMTSRVNVNNAICRRSVHEISFKRSAFDFMHSNRLCRWRYLLSLGEESMRAGNINMHLSDSLTVLIKAPSTRNPSISHS